MKPRLTPRILSSCTLPWTDRFELEESLFRDVIRGQLAQDHTSIYLFGTAGEGYAVYKPQRGEAPLSDFPGGTLFKREQASYVVSEALGWGLVPPTIVRADGLESAST